MDGCNFDLGGTQLTALPSGALWWADMSALIVSDLHLGRSQRIARLGGGLLPPYEVTDTLLRLDQDIAAARPRLVICLGDTFDDAQAANLAPDHALWLTRLMAGRRWVWIEGNHDPGPLYVGGEHRAELPLPPLTFRHIAQSGALAEVSGHYHPKARLAGQSCRCFLFDDARVILPAYGTFTGGLDWGDAAFRGLLKPGAQAILIGRVPRAVPMPGQRP